MSVTRNALWIIERNLSAPLSLTEIARACGVSPFHLAHAFGDATGVPVIAYLRGRRLAVAAEALAAGAPDILSLTLETGYGSHEAFSRAFRASLGTTPEAVREARTTKGLPMTEAMSPPEPSATPLPAPRFVDGPEMIVVGLSQKQTPYGPSPAFAQQWQAFMARYHEIDHKIGGPPIGVASIANEEGIFDYLTGAEVTRVDSIPAGFVKTTIPARRYAVFAHRSHVSELGRTHAAIWDEWLPSSGHQPADAPLIERHCDTFDRRTGLGGVDIWIPLVR